MRLEKFDRLIELVWADLKPLLNGTSASLPYIEGADSLGNPEIAAVDGAVVYIALINVPADVVEWQALKPSISKYIDREVASVVGGTLNVTNRVDTKLQGVVGVDVMRSGVSTTTYNMVVDLDNPSGSYKHTGSAGVILYASSATLIKSSTGAAWSALVGVILTIDGTSANVAWLELTSLHAEDSSSDVVQRSNGMFPVPVDLTVVGGGLPAIATGFTEVITTINTGMTLLDVAGVSRTPAVGDLVSRVEHLSGAGTADLHTSIWYVGV